MRAFSRRERASRLRFSGGWEEICELDGSARGAGVVVCIATAREAWIGGHDKEGFSECCGREEGRDG